MSGSSPSTALRRRRRSTSPSPRRSRSRSATPSSPRKTVDDSVKANGNDGTVPQPPTEEKWRKWWKRTWSTLAMIFGYFGYLYIAQCPGHILLIIFTQVMMYKELVNIALKKNKEDDLPGFGFFYWYWFIVGLIFMWGVSLHDVLLASDLPESVHWLVSQSNFIAYSLWVFGLVLFVLSLRRRRLYMYQFSQFGFCHMAILVLVGPSTMLAANLFSGIIWFTIPCGMVVCNDCWAYISGFFFGKTPLIPRLSPKKTWEGFIGGFLATVLWSYWFTRLLQTGPVADFYACPHTSLSLSNAPCNSLESDLYSLHPLSSYLGMFSPYLPLMFDFGTSKMMLHAVAMSVFASFVAPFGGFFASGFKRAFKIKDFGDSIPGHGGVVDRMDCQIIMGAFAYMYYHNFVAASDPVQSALSQFCQLSSAQQEAFRAAMDSTCS